METTLASYQISPAGDSAILIDFGNRIDEEVNKKVLARTKQLKDQLKGVSEIVAAYSSISIYYDLPGLKKHVPKGMLVFDHLKHLIEQLLLQPIADHNDPDKLVTIPVCYTGEFAPDIETLAKSNAISIEEVIAFHISKIYRVYMLGFLPGFSYLGEVNEKISMPRKMYPQAVEAGAVGIAARQTGIYPLASPGGWQIIGRTPLKLFDARAEQPALLHPGDRVQFYSIAIDEYYDIQTNRQASA